MSGSDIARRPRARAAGPLLLSVALLALAACQPLGEGDDGSPGGSEDSDTGRLSIATGGTGGVYFPLGGGLADLISETSRATRLRPRRRMPPLTT